MFKKSVNHSPKYRALNKDGTDNIDRSELKRHWGDLYHLLLSQSWPRFFLTTLIAYLFINLFFGVLYFILGPEGLQGHTTSGGLDFFEECVFFSIQTFSTIGYGRVSPVGFLHNALVSIEAFTGMLSIAVMSGLLFARFSRPTAKIRFSDMALVTQHLGQRSLVFRLANARLNQIAEAQISVVIIKNVKTSDGQQLRQQFDVQLIRHKNLFFAGSWLVAHIIDEKSPLYKETKETLEKQEAEIFISVTGYDITYSQSIYARNSYLWDEIVWDRSFADMVTRKDGRIAVDISKLSDLKEN